MEQKLPEKKMPSMHANATNLVAKLVELCVMNHTKFAVSQVK